MQRMSKKMDVGWKLTNLNCEVCNGVTMLDPSNSVEYYCPKCDKTMEFKFDPEISNIDNNHNNQYTDPE